MEELINDRKERYILIAVSRGDQERAEASLDELERLLDTAGGETACQVVQNLQHPDRGTYIGKGKALEINTKSIRKHLDGGFTRHLPDEAILNRYRAMGGNLICLGSDSHFPGTFGVCFDEAIQYLKSLGFPESVYFKDHTPYFEPL